MQPNPNNNSIRVTSNAASQQPAHACDSAQERHNEQVLLTRRRFLYGSLGVGALALGAHSLGAFPKKAFADEDIDYLRVSQNQVFTNEDCKEISPAKKVSLVGNFRLPYGTLIWCNSSKVAACLLPTKTSNPLTKVAVLFLESGETATILKAAVGQTDGFEIYDARVNDKGVIWTEANILSGIWRVYTATLNGENLGEARLVDEGEVGWETPTIATVAQYGFWQVLPHADGEYRREDSLLKKAEFGSDSTEVVYASTGRMSTPPYALEDSLVIAPRTKTDAVHHQLTLLDATSNEVKDALVLPQGMKPLEAGYGPTGFSFSFDGWYDYGEGIAEIGTYTPAEYHDPNDYHDKTWFRFGRAPSAPPAWCDTVFLVKSSRAVCGVDLDKKTWFALDVDNNASPYGDYLASTGSFGSFVTYTNIHSVSIEGDEEKYCQVRVWSASA